tara:strand:+ start:712 stop:906 length:195 start_codon:yes stop_codon:yes gene_type:complete
MEELITDKLDKKMEDDWDRELTQDQVIGILENHSQTEEEIETFFNHKGYRDVYIGSEVFIWLGY